MKLLQATVKSSCEIALIGDTHDGSLCFHEHGVDQVLEWIKAGKNRYFVFMGDAVEAITTDDERYQNDTSKEAIPLKQARNVIKRFRSVSKRGLGWLTGNHEWTLHRFGDLAEHMATELEIPYGTWTCKLRLDDKHGQLFKLYATHGGRGQITSNAKDHEQREANMKASLKRRFVNKASDCLVMACGHFHKLIRVPPAERLIMSDDGEKLIQNYLSGGEGAASYIEPDRRWYFCTGSFLKTYELGVSSYGERAGYDPVELGLGVIRIEDRQVVDVEKVVVD